MRDYRGKRKDNGEWVYGLPAKLIQSTDGKRTEHVYIGKTYDSLHDSLHEVIPETVGQATGLKDKNNTGEDLYADDVVYLAGYGNYRCVFPFIELYEAMAEGDIGDKLGNIHTNPELTKPTAGVVETGGGDE